MAGILHESRGTGQTRHRHGREQAPKDAPVPLRDSGVGGVPTLSFLCGVLRGRRGHPSRACSCHALWALGPIVESRRRDVCVAQPFLDFGDVGLMLKRVGRGGNPECAGSEVFDVDVGLGGVTFREGSWEGRTCEDLRGRSRSLLRTHFLAASCKDLFLHALSNFMSIPWHVAPRSYSNLPRSGF